MKTYVVIACLLILTGCTVVYYGSVGSRKTLDVQAPTWGVRYDSDATTTTAEAINTAGELAPIVGALK